MVRVSSTKLDSLVSLVGELVITQARLSQLTAHATDPALAASVEALERLVVELRDGVLGVQMMPIGSTFGRFNRLVHDSAASLGKKVDLVTEGAEHELRQERPRPPRRSPAAPVATPSITGSRARSCAWRGQARPRSRAARRSARRSVRGHHDRDDGNGLDADAIGAKGIERGVISPEQSLFRPASS